jgi:hypothetical protein
MASRITAAFACALLLAAPVAAQTIIVQDNFDSYPSDTEFLAQWVPTTGLGTAPAEGADLNSAIITADDTTFPGIQGKAVDHIGATASTPGMVNQWGGVIDQTSAQNPDFTINPSATESVFLKADIFVGSSGNERMSVGLRSTVAIPDGTDTDTFPDANSANIFEMGVYNATPTVLGIENTSQIATGYAFRIINFGTASPPLPGQPNWQYFLLSAELDRTTDLDDVVNIGDIGAGWHTYTAEFSPTDITITLDLFRDGFVNTRDETGAIVATTTAGPDASITLPVATNVAGFNNLRIGGPSGLSSAGAGAMGFDNILLQLQDAGVEPEDDADFDGDGDVDGNDFIVWQQGIGAGDQSDGDANGDNVVDGLDLDVWKQQYAQPAPPVSAIPEPATLVLLGFAALAGLTATRRQ